MHMDMSAEFSAAVLVFHLRLEFVVYLSLLVVWMFSLRLASSSVNMSRLVILMGYFFRHLGASDLLNAIFGRVCGVFRIGRLYFLFYMLFSEFDPPIIQNCAVR